MRALILAFATYSRIPMPQTEWDARSMKYSLCFFPCVGGVIGLCSFFLYQLLSGLGMGRLLTAAFLEALPLLLTGGIHMDGFLDTVDALSSCRPREEKLRILKDPHTGAFAVIYGGVYFLLCFGLFTEITRRAAGMAALGYVYSRVLSGLSVVLFRKAKTEGMAAASADAADKSVAWILLAEGALCIAAFVGLFRTGGLCCVLAGLAGFWYYQRMAYRAFGGMTGDLAGYFLQVCEGLLLFAAVFSCRFIA